MDNAKKGTENISAETVVALRNKINALGPAESLRTAAIKPGTPAFECVIDECQMLSGSKEQKEDFLKRAIEKDSSIEGKWEPGFVAFTGPNAQAIADLLMEKGLSVAKIPPFTPTTKIEPDPYPKRAIKERIARGPIKYDKKTGLPLPKKTEYSRVRIDWTEYEPRTDKEKEYLDLIQSGVSARPETFIILHGDANQLDHDRGYSIENQDSTLANQVAAPIHEKQAKHFFSK